MMTTRIPYQPRLWCNKIINQSLTPYYQISVVISSFIEKLFRTTPNSELKTGKRNQQAWLFLLSAHQRDMRSDAVQDPIFFTSRSIYRT
jgi:hypothetical protein